MKLSLHSTKESVGDIALTRRGFSIETASVGSHGPRLPLILGLGYITAALAILIYCGA